jgi:23S rRNA (adenine2503-C2)-methyltransferase
MVCVKGDVMGEVFNAAKGPSTKVVFRAVEVAGFRTGVLDISMLASRVLSIPTQLGCRVGCTFCISSTAPLVRNLSADEMLQMVRMCLKENPADGRPIELSFTGEGEALMNWKETQEVYRKLPTVSPNFSAVRYCFSGIGADKLLKKLTCDRYPVRLQFSLHAARQQLRERLIPRSLPLDNILAAMLAHAHQFSAIQLNYVLQNGVNDSDKDLAALISWGDPAWPILLNPLLQDGIEHVADRTDHFEARLQAAGRQVLRYSKIGSVISRDRIYPLLTARKFNR